MALGDRLGTKKQATWSGRLLQFAGGFALAKRYGKGCMYELALREKLPARLQIWCLKPLREPVVHPLKPTGGISRSTLCLP